MWLENGTDCKNVVFLINKLNSFIIIKSPLICGKNIKKTLVGKNLQTLHSETAIYPQLHPALYFVDLN